jgi:ankyrin repeat protein/serine/threonine protein kinase
MDFRLFPFFFFFFFFFFFTQQFFFFFFFFFFQPFQLKDEDSLASGALAHLAPLRAKCSADELVLCVVGPYVLLVDRVARTVAIATALVDGWLATFSFGDVFATSATTNAAGSATAPLPITSVSAFAASALPSAGATTSLVPSSMPAAAAAAAAAAASSGGSALGSDSSLANSKSGRVAVFGNANWLVLASATTVAVWDWEPLLQQKNLRAQHVAPSRVVRLIAQQPNPTTDEIDVVLEPSSHLCHVDARCRVLLGSPRSLLVYDVPKNQELFRYALSLQAPSIGPFFHVAWQRDTICTLEERGARFWSLKHKLDRPVAPLIAPDVPSATFKAADFIDKTSVVLGDTLGRLRVIQLADVPAMQSQADWIAEQRPVSGDDPDSANRSGDPQEVYGAMPAPARDSKTGESLTSPRVLAGELGVFSELIKSSSLAMLKAAVKRKLPNQLADLRALRDGRQRTALHVAAERNRVEIATYLIRKSDLKFLNTPDALGRTSMHIAALAHACEICRQLLRAGARASQRDVRGATSLHALVQQRWPKSASAKSALLRVSESLRAVLGADDAARSSALASIEESIARDVPRSELAAAALTRATVSELRLLSGDDAAPGDDDSEVERRPSLGALAVPQATQSRSGVPDDNTDEVSLPALLACFSALVGINARDADESTPLMIACYSDNVEAVRVLLHLGADVQLARADGDTALHVAVRRAAADSARMLLQAGASPHAPNRLGETSWTLAGRSGSEAVLAVLSEMQPRNTLDMTLGGGSGDDDDDHSTGSMGSVGSSAPSALRAAHVRAHSARVPSQQGSPLPSAHMSSPQLVHSPSTPVASTATTTVGSHGSPVTTLAAAAAAPVAPGSPAATQKRSLRSKLARLTRGNSESVSAETLAAWFAAASSGSIENLKDLQKKIGVSAFLLRDKHEQTALHRAAFKGHTGVVVWLLGHKKAPQQYLHATDKNGWTALHGAASVGNIDVCSVLLDGGADPTRPALPEHGGTTPLHYAVRIKWKAPALPVLLTRMLDAPQNSAANPVEVRDQRGTTPLLGACWKGSREAVAFLLGRKASLTAVDSAGEGALHYAARGNQVQTIELLLSRGCDLMARSAANETAFDIASANGAAEAKAWLADVLRSRHGDRGGASASTSASAAQNAPAVAVQSMRGGSGSIPRHDSGADSDGADDDSTRSALSNAPSLSASGAVAQHSAARIALAKEMAPLFDAAAKGLLVNVRTLVKLNPIRTFEAATLDQGRTVLHLAVDGGHIEIVTWLLGYKRRPAALVHRTDVNGLTALHISASYPEGRDKVTRLLVRCGSDAFVPAGARHSTALHDIAAAKWLGEESASLLDDILGIAKADAEAANKTVLQIVERGLKIGAAPPGDDAAAPVPATKRAALAVFIDPRDALGATPLMSAAAAGRAEACIYLVSRGARIDITDAIGDSVMHYGVRGGSLDTVRALLACQVPYKARGARDTPLQLANDKKLHAISQLLQRQSDSEMMARRRTNRSSFRLLHTNDWQQLAMRKKPTAVPQSAMLEMVEKPVMLKSSEYVTTSAPTPLLYGCETAIGDVASAVIERLLVANGRVFAAQRGGALSVWDATKRGAWQPLAVRVCEANAVVAFDERDGVIVAVFALTLAAQKLIELAALVADHPNLAIMQPAPVQVQSSSSASSSKSGSVTSEYATLPERSSRMRSSTDIKARDAVVAQLKRVPTKTLDEKAALDASRGSLYMNDSKGVLQTYQLDIDASLCDRLTVLSVRADFKPRATQERIVPSDLKRIKEIGRGAFGTVWYGEWRGRPVAIKEPRETADTANDGINAALVEEAGRLSALPPHNNVLRLYGVCAGIDHQMLTNRGFLFLDQVLALVERDADGWVTDWRGLRVANYDPATMQLVYDEPCALIVTQSDELVEFTSSAAASARDPLVSVHTTPEHELFVLPASSKRSMTRDETQPALYAKLAADKALAHEAVHFLARAENGIDADCGAAPLYDAQLELYGRWLGGGAVRRADGALLLRDGLASNVIDDECIAPLCDDGVRLGEWCWSLPAAGARAILRGLREGEHIYTDDAEFRDQVVRLALHAGFTAAFDRVSSTSSMWRIVLAEASNVDRPLLRRNVDQVARIKNPHADRRVWCFRMPRRADRRVLDATGGGFVVMRRAALGDDGATVVQASRPTVQGNCSTPPVCIVTEYCKHGSLNALLYGDSPDPLMADATLDRCVVDAALGLYHLHANGVVHRDIAARNILVDENYRAKVADFGMARTAGEDGDYTVCFDAVDHQLLTSDGFLFLDELLSRVEWRVVGGRVRVVDWRGLEAATYDPLTARLVYREPRAIGINVGEQCFVELGARKTGVSVVATDNHELYLRIEATTEFAKVSAAALLRSGAESVRMLSAARHGVAVRKATHMPALAASSVWLEVYGFWLCDGALHVPANGMPVVTFRVVKRRDDAFLRRALVSLGLLAIEDGRVAPAGDCDVDGDVARWWSDRSNFATVYADDGVPLCVMSDADARGAVLYCINDERWVRLFATEYAQASVNGESCLAWLRASCGWSEARVDATKPVGESKWFAAWVLDGLSRDGVRAVLSGMRRDGDVGSISVSSVLLRDQLERALLHAGYSAVSTSLGSSWRVAYSDVSEPSVSLSAAAVHSERRRRVSWCFDMQSCAGANDGFVVVRRADRVERAADGDVAATRARLVEQLSDVSVDHLAERLSAHASGRCWETVGASRATIQGNSSSGPLKWMAPEQLERRKFSFRSDVWAFGCLMYECYARRKPWDGYTNAAAVHKVLSAQRMAPPKTAPPVIAELMRRCWHSKPNKRPSMADICTALSAAVGVSESDQESVQTDYGDMLVAYPNVAGDEHLSDDDAEKH